MQRQHFEAIIESLEAHHNDNNLQLRVSLRNGEVYHGGWTALEAAPDVIVIDDQRGLINIALTAIATISVWRT
jgi:hypothetical protein